jgi:hypothetical protein
MLIMFILFLRTKKHPLHYQRVATFIVKTRNAFTIVENMMKSFQFEEDISWPYDPLKVISNMIISVGIVAYTHQVDAEKEILTNKYSWIEVQKVMQE